ncbi:Response regulator PleD [Zhongshania aliphaticivorans]|uniref:diguanylate cyclase n=1 Tax=Zhongshania aliphaticivorans TaxID=1470434 RepID=A0A5S9Q055_9GAMM|nr:diguanylate cyclase [Zhongshania aliphaticivorans]CAA0092839.1 Response regulator PleD [Zhongshania aliphaticivorans]CAA0110393.1 Response regulator PleD [Zhongshania aliphaticivorans]
MSEAHSLFASDLIPGATIPDRPTLLVVDDQPVNIQVLYQVFSASCDVFMATSGKQALEVCSQKNPDLILLDVVMPEMDGIEVCRRLKSEVETRDIPVIFVTSQDSPEEETLGLEVGAVDFITKPVNPAVVKARVKTHLMLKIQADALRELASVDGLTGIANRRRFDERLDAEWRACRRTEQPLSIIMMDVDHFKKYNDHYGHLEGDGCLKMVAHALTEDQWRGRDIVSRYGGEEFVCLMPETHLDDAIKKAEMIRQRVFDLALPHAASDTADRVTISIGAACVVPNDSDFKTLLLRADEQLYKAKEGGRNRVEGACL